LRKSVSWMSFKTREEQIEYHCVYKHCRILRCVAKPCAEFHCCIYKRIHCQTDLAGFQRGYFTAQITPLMYRL
jgi:hypothetical protein